MAISGIYQKTCPSCASQVSIDDARCNCGYSFRNDADASDLPPEELLAQIQLQQEYVKARIAQSMENLEVLHAALQADPKNFDKANKLMTAFAEVRGLRAELAELAASSAELTGSVKKVAEPGMSSEPSAAFRAAQLLKAEKIMQAAGMATKECIKCHAVLPQRAALCFCGYAFSQTDSSASADSSVGTDQQKGI
jgi:hypothetical protein